MRHEVAADKPTVAEQHDSPQVHRPDLRHTLLLAPPRYLNQSAVASSIFAAVHTGASLHPSIFSSMMRTPSSKRVRGSHLSSRRIMAMSPNVHSGSPGRLGMFTFGPSRSSTSRLTL